MYTSPKWGYKQLMRARTECHSGWTGNKHQHERKIIGVTDSDSLKPQNYVEKRHLHSILEMLL